MKIETSLSCGDKAWVYDGHKGAMQVTVGQVRVEFTSTKGVKDSMFTNYQAQKGFKEQYMCVETGVGSGSVWEWGKSIWGTEKDCLKGNEVRIKEAKERAESQRKQEIVWALEEKRAVEEKLRRLEAA